MPVRIVACAVQAYASASASVVDVTLVLVADDRCSDALLMVVEVFG